MAFELWVFVCFLCGWGENFVRVKKRSQISESWVDDCLAPRKIKTLVSQLPTASCCTETKIMCTISLKFSFSFLGFLSNYDTFRDRITLNHLLGVVSSNLLFGSSGPGGKWKKFKISDRLLHAEIIQHLCLVRITRSFLSRFNLTVKWSGGFHLWNRIFKILIPFLFRPFSATEAFRVFEVLLLWTVRACVLFSFLSIFFYRPRVWSTIYPWMNLRSCHCC